MNRSRLLLSSSLRASRRTPAPTTSSLPTLSLRQQPLFTQIRHASHGHAETFEEFTARYVSFFTSAQDLFEVQRGLNNCFAHDLVPAPAVVEAALRAARRVNDYATAVRVFEGIKAKVENKQQYEGYLEELKGTKEELGVETKEELYNL